MVKLLLGLWMAGSCLRAESLCLKGFTLVDPATRSERVADIYVEDGHIVPKIPGRYRTIEGKGRWLLPAFWDLDASLWGNDSAKDYHILAQHMSIPFALRIQLYHGVGHVIGTHLDQDDLDTDFKRLQSLQIPAAEMIYPGKGLAGPGGKDWAASPLTATSQIGPLLQSLKAQDLPLVQVSYGDPQDKVAPGMSKELLQAVLQEARARHLKSYVFVNTWARAQDAVGFGADAIAGLPSGPLPVGFASLMKHKGCAYAPYLAFYLELPRLLGHNKAVYEPFVQETVSMPVLESFINPQELWERWKAPLAHGIEAQSSALRSLKQLAAAGVPLLNATGAGWSAGVFQGYASHANQAWMEKAHIDSWTRLEALTAWPAEFLGRKIGFDEGRGANFIALDGDPLKSAAALHAISLIIRSGNEIHRADLKPDLSRQKFRPYR